MNYKESVSSIGFPLNDETAARIQHWISQRSGGDAAFHISYRRDRKIYVGGTTATMPEEFCVTEDESQIPPDAIHVEEFKEGEQVGGEFIGNDGKTYRSIHVHEPATSSLGLVPLKNVLIEG